MTTRTDRGYSTSYTVEQSPDEVYAAVLRSEWRVALDWDG